MIILAWVFIGLTAYVCLIAVAESYENYARSKRLDKLAKFYTDLNRYDERDHD